MIIQQEKRDVTARGVMSVHKATISQSSKVFDFFASQTYSDKFKAIVRELTANAIDAHTEAGNPDPVHIYLPDVFDPYFRVKDTGIGMSHEFCTTNFMCYSDGSTKDNSDLVIGGFGIGSKSPFAYTDQFTLRSIHNGIASVYSVFKDEDGIPSIGLLEQKPTNEVNGVEFSLPVDEEDFDNFKVAALTGLPYFFNRVKLHGETLEDPVFRQRGGTWGIRSDSARNPQVIMGGVAYPINNTQMDYSLRYDDRLGPLLDMALDLFLPIGSCSVTLSRESLLYDEKTKAAIQLALESIIDEIIEDIPTMFDHLPGQWAASKALSEYLSGDLHTPRSRLVLAHAQFQGKPLQTHFSAVPTGTQKIWVIPKRSPCGGRRSGPKECPNPRWEFANYLDPYAYHTVIIDDLPTTSRSATIKRIKTFVDDDLEMQAAVLVIRPLEFNDIGPALKAFGDLSAGDYILSSSLPEPVRAERTSQEKLQRPAVRMFELSHRGVRKRMPTITHKKSGSPVVEIDYVDQPTTGILVTMDNFELPTGFWTKYFLFEREELYFANKSDALKLKQFVSFEEESQGRLEAKLAENPNIAHSQALSQTHLATLLRLAVKHPTLFDKLSKTKPMFRLRTLAEQYFVPVDSNLIPFFEPSLPPRLNPEDLYNKIQATHWKFMTFYEHCPSYKINDTSPEFQLLKELLS